MADDPVGGQLVSRTPQMDQPLPQGEPFTFLFSPQEFPEDADLSEFNFKISVFLKDGVSVRAGEKVSVSLSPGEEYRFVLFEKQKESFALMPVGE